MCIAAMLCAAAAAHAEIATSKAQIPPPTPNATRNLIKISILFHLEFNGVTDGGDGLALQRGRFGK